MILALRPVWPVAAILLAAVVAAWAGSPLPASLEGLRTAGPYTLLVAAVAVSLWFNRERAFAVSLSLLAAFAAYDYFPSPLAYVAGATLVPLNAFVAHVLPERGARFGRAWRWVALVVVEVLLVYVLKSSVDEKELLDSLGLRMPPTPPLIARLAFSAAFGAAVWRAFPNHTPIEIGLAGALAAYFLACGWHLDPRIYSVYVFTAAAVILVSVLHESHRMAFRDGLTGLPNRRALEEQLRALRPPYAIGMVDVDHFKAFNDTHGHDIGDQVLKLVASRMAEAGGGGRSFRYGGEEFTVLFRGMRLAEAMPHLEALRAAVESYKMTVRGEDRPKDKKDGAKRRADGRQLAPVQVQDFEKTDQLLSVTVSVGGAEPGKRLKTPAEVVKGADEALYRAKERGRNRVSR